MHAFLPLKADLSAVYTSECKRKESSERDLKVSVFNNKEVKLKSDLDDKIQLNFKYSRDSKYQNFYK